MEAKPQLSCTCAISIWQAPSKTLSVIQVSAFGKDSYTQRVAKRNGSAVKSSSLKRERKSCSDSWKPIAFPSPLEYVVFKMQPPCLN